MLCEINNLEVGTRFGRLPNFVELAGQPHKIWKILPSLPNFIGEKQNLEDVWRRGIRQNKIWNEKFDLRQAPITDVQIYFSDAKVHYVTCHLSSAFNELSNDVLNIRNGGRIDQK